jgi:hypothetical protein
MYKFTSIGRPLDPAFPTNKAVLVILPLAALLGAVLSWADGDATVQVLRSAGSFLLIAFGSWALARELFPDDSSAAFVSMALALLVALFLESPSVLILFSTLGLVRLVNRSTGVAAKLSDSIIVLLLSFWVIYSTGSPFYGAVAALAFALDGSLKHPLRHQWVFALICFGGMIVYMVDHDVGRSLFAVPATLAEWLSLAVLLVLALDMILLKDVRSRADATGRQLNLSRVKYGLAVGLLAAFQGLLTVQGVEMLVATMAGIVVGMAFRKSFQAPPAG